MARMSRQDRRQQLLDLGAEMITASSFDEFSIDDLAREAGISRSLLFHYFANRQEFLVAVATEAAREVLEVTDVSPDLPGPVALVAGIEGFLDFIAERGDQYVALVRGAAGGDARMQRVFAETREALAGRVLDGVEDLGEQPELVRLAVRGQIALSEEVITSWLVSPDHDQVSREDLVQLLATSMVDLLRRSGAVFDDQTLELVEALDA